MKGRSPRYMEPSRWADLRFVLPFLMPHLGLIVCSIACMILFALTTSTYAYLAGPVVHIVLHSLGAGSISDATAGGPGDEPGQVAGPHEAALGLVEGLSHFLGLSQVVVLASAVMLLAIVRCVAHFGQSVLMGRAGQNIQRDVRDAMFEKLMAAEPLAMMGVQKGDLVSRVVADVTFMEVAITHATATIIQDGLQVIFLATLAFYLDPLLSLIAMLVIPVGVLVVWKVGGRIRAAYRTAMNLRGGVAGLFVEAARGLPVIKIFLAEEKQVERFKATSAKLREAMMKAIMLASIPSPTLEIMGMASLVFLLLYVTFISKGPLQHPAQLISYFATLFLLQRPLRSLGTVTSLLLQGMAATCRIRQFFEIQEEAAMSTTHRFPSTEFSGGGGLRRMAPPLGEAIRFENVSFGYGERCILGRLSLTIPRGKVTAIAGASGEGKTTIVYLLCGFMHPTGGRITWDGIDYREIEPKSLRRRIALISQDSFLMNSTIEENILMGCGEGGARGGKEGEIRAAVAVADLERLVAQLPDGLKTEVGEEASFLSGGEKQRVCIARAALKGGDLLIFDEAASSLDSRSEDLIRDALGKLGGARGGMTMVIISHRLSTLRMADRICLLEGGRIVEEGSFEELARPGTSFHRLFAGQLAVQTDR